MHWERRVLATEPPGTSCGWASCHLFELLQLPSNLPSCLFLQTICHTVPHNNYYMKARSSCPSLRSLGTSPLPPEKEPPVPFLPVFPGVGWGPPNPGRLLPRLLSKDFPLCSWSPHLQPQHFSLALFLRVGSLVSYACLSFVFSAGEDWSQTGQFPALCSA